MENVNRRKTRTITCAGCGLVATGRMKATTRYCSRECYLRVIVTPNPKQGEVRQCAACGKDVYIPRNRLGLDRYFCCRDHANQWQGRNKIAYNCKVCGVLVKRSPSSAVWSNKRYCSRRCQYECPDYRAMLCKANADQAQKKTNKLEAFGYALLDTIGVEYLKQHVLFRKFCVDAFFPSASIVVQFDGDYWHGNPAKYPEPSPRQSRRMKLDASQDAYLATCSISVVRVWESSLRSDPLAFLHTVEDAISSHATPSS